MQDIYYLVPNWTYEPSSIKITLEFKRSIRRWLGKSSFPQYKIVREPFLEGRWIALFLYSPKGELDPSQAFTLQVLCKFNIPLLVVVSTPDEFSVDPLVLECADAIIWKSLNGYDFSAYGLMLREISIFSPGADVLLLNDSNFGPFFDLSACFPAAAWDLTGFTASYLIEDHIQSYAFVVKNVTSERLLDMEEIFPQTHAYDSMNDVVLLQELSLARMACRTMTVGAFWYLPKTTGMIDPTLACPIELLELGHPFMKKSLFGKHSRYADRPRLVIELLRRGHPPLETI